MRTGISFTLCDGDRQRLDAIVAGGNTPQKHVWRARIVLLSAGGVGTNAIIAATGKSKTCVWHWQERFCAEGRIPKLAPTVAERVVELTLEPPPDETTSLPQR